MDFSTLQSEVRSRLVEAAARAFTDVEIKRWINLGYRNVISQTGWAERLSAKAVVANQYEYDVPTDCSKIKQIRWQDQFLIAPATNEEFAASVNQANTSTSTRPEIYTALPWDRTFRIYPIPSASSPSTAINDVGNLSSSATSVTVDSTTDFPSTGIVLIDTEQILYTAKTATTLTGLVRGHGRTTAASHLDNATVTVGEMHIYNTYMPADLSASGDEPLINEEWHELLVLYAVQIGLQKRQKYVEAMKIYQVYQEQLREARQFRINQDLEGHTHIADADTMEYGF